MTQQKKGQQNQNPEARMRVERKKRKATFLSYIIMIMAGIYYADFLMIDSLIYGVTGFFDAVFGTAFLSSVKGGLGTLKFFGFGGFAAFAWYLSRQEA